MSRPEFENQTQISAVTSKTVTSVNVKNTFALAHQQYDVTKIYSPKGTISRVMGLEAYFPATGGTANTEKNLIISLVEFQADGVTPKTVLEQIAFSASDMQNAKIEYGVPMAVNSYFPNDLSAFHAQLRGMIFDDEKCLQLAFYNNTGVTINTAREFNIFIEREVIKR